MGRTTKADSHHQNQENVLLREIHREIVVQTISLSATMIAKKTAELLWFEEIV